MDLTLIFMLQNNLFDETARSFNLKCKIIPTNIKWRLKTLNKFN